MGASARAAAWSALRSGGIEPWCVDLFADADLQQACAARAIPASAYPGGFLEAARRAPPGPWIYTGALENHPQLIAAIARERPLWGNPEEVVSRVRSPVLVAQVLRRAALPCPAVTETLPAGGAKRWLIKPRHSAGGAKVRWWRGQAIPASCYGQAWIEGNPCSALFAGRRDGSVNLLGATRQLIGLPWLHAGEFRYCGNIGPLVLSRAAVARLQRIGDVLASDLSLRGFFGVDFILQDDVSWPVEINPRYTASIEILERGAGTSLFSYHRRTFTEACHGGPNGPARKTHGFHGKAILFAKEPFLFPALGPWQESLHRPWTELEGPDYADIPQPHTPIARGQPILTLFARADSEAESLDFLREKAQALDRRLFAS